MTPSLPRTIALTAALAVAAPFVDARAETEGRIGLQNMYSQMTGPDASFDAAVLRIWLRSERIAGRNMALIVDSRSSIPVLAAPAEKYPQLTGVKSVFNEHCRGDADAEVHPECRDVPYRETRMGQLLHQAGIYDAYFRFGDIGPGRSALSVGRKTIYEAGLAAVDGVVFERGLDKSRFGLFGGASPDPLSRMFTPDYQAAGGYYAVQREKLWVRLGVVGQLYKFEPDRVTIHNHDFFAISKSLRVAAMIQFDAIPDAQERLVNVDLTFRPSGQYRFRGSVTRFRPWNYAVSESHVVQYPEGRLIDDFRAARDEGTSNLRTDYRNPEVLEDELRTSAVNQAKLVAHYTTARSLTPFLSAAFRTREIDGATSILAGGGLYGYDVYDTGITGRLRLDHVIGFDYDTDRVMLTAERRMSDSFAFGGGLEFGLNSYRLEDTPLDEGKTESSTWYGANVMVRNDKMSGLSLFLQVDYTVETRDVGGQVDEDDVLLAAPASTTIFATAGVTYRFGGAR